MKRMLLILLATTGALAGSRTPAWAASAGDEMVCLGVRETDLKNAPPQPAGILMREIARQAFLIAARDECGLATRDAALREAMSDASGGKLALFQVLVSTLQASSCDVHVLLTRGDQTQQSRLVDRSFLVPRTELLVQLVEKCESLSRNEFKDVLGREVHPQKLAAARTAGEPPKPIVEQLAQWNEMAVVGGLRSLHAEILAKGESPELLAALARAYANLGVMTERFWSPAHKAYKARALLYAERLVHKTDGSARALCSRAYVRALVGLHAAAVADIQRARDQVAKVAGGKPLPEWVGTIDLFCHGKTEQMIADAKTEPNRSLASLLRLLLLENTGYEYRINDAAQALLELQPDSFRAFQSKFESPILAVEQQMVPAGSAFLFKSVAARLSGVAGLPASVREKLDATLKGQSPEEQIASWLETVTALSAAGRPGGDRHEPSLDALAALIREIQFVLARRQIEFAHWMGSDSSQLRTSLGTWVKKHPYAAWMDAYVDEPSARTRPYKALLKIDPSELELTESTMIGWLNQQDARSEQESKRLLANHSDPIYRDLIMRYAAGLLRRAEGDKRNGETAQLLRSVSPWTSTFVGMQIHVDGTAMDQEAARLERDYASDFLVLSELANRHIEMNRFDDAERCLKRLVRIDPRFDAYWRLATIYKLKGNSVRWKETLEKSLELSSGGLEHAQVRVALAEYHMLRNELDPALQYAKQAAQSYSAWSLMTLARCYELRQEWNEAEQVLRALTQQYRDQTLEWTFFCARSGQGNAEEAQKAGREFVDALGSGISQNNVGEVATFYVLTKEPKKALAIYQEGPYRTKNPYDALYAALVADNVGDAALRDALLTKIVTEEKRTSATARAYVEVAAMMRAAVQRESPKPLDLDRIEPLIAHTESGEPTNFYYFVGAFLQNRGDLQHAKKYLMLSATSPLYQKYTVALASLALHDLKVPIQRTRNEEIAKP